MQPKITKTSHQIVGFFPGNRTWKKVNEVKYRREFTHNHAILYLKQELYESITREILCISEGKNAGFYAAIRFLFPEVSHLGNLYFGNIDDAKEPEYACKYMEQFLILSPTPRLHWDIFRNGLMHSHHPKWLRKNKGSWYISNDKKLDNEFGIFTKGFADEICESIEFFIFLYLN